MEICIHPLLSEEQDLPFVVCAIGSQEKQCPIKRKQGHPLHQLIFSRKGSGVLHSVTQSYMINEGDYFYLKANEAHHYESKSAIWSTDWLMFKGQQIDNTLSVLGFDSTQKYVYKNNPKITTHFMKMIATLQNQHQQAGFMASSQLYEMLILLQQNNRVDNLYHVKNAKQIITPLLDYIEQHYTQDICLSDLASLVMITPQHLCKVFKEHLNMRPFEYIIKRRLQQAKKMLLESSTSIKDISKAVGYEDNSYFSVLFKRHEGVTASHYRGRKNNKNFSINEFKQIG